MRRCSVEVFTVKDVDLLQKWEKAMSGCGNAAVRFCYSKIVWHRHFLPMLVDFTRILSTGKSALRQAQGRLCATLAGAFLPRSAFAYGAYAFMKISRKNGNFPISDPVTGVTFLRSVHGFDPRQMH